LRQKVFDSEESTTVLEDIIKISRHSTSNFIRFRLDPSASAFKAAQKSAGEAEMILGSMRITVKKNACSDPSGFFVE